MADSFTGVAEADDLGVRAANLLQMQANIAQGVDIAIEKHIPTGGGFGGGSSDAATVLVALNHLWDLGWPAERLAQLGLRLGADVPVVGQVREVLESRHDRLLAGDLALG